MITRLFASVLVGLLFGLSIYAQSPTLNYCIPSAVVPGKTTDVTFFGDKLKGTTALWTNFPVTAVLLPGGDDGKTVFRMTVPADAQPGIGAVRVATTNGISSLQPLMIDDLPSVTENGTNKTMLTAQELTLPVAVDGAGEELSFDYYKFTARKGQQISIEIVSQRLGSRFDPLVRLLDAKGRELVYCDDEPGIAPDGRFTYQFAARGDYFLEIRDMNYLGGRQYRYRLRLGNFPLATTAFPMTLKPGGTSKVAFLGRGVGRVKPASVSMPDRAERMPLGVRYPAGQGSGFVAVMAAEREPFVEIEPNDATNNATQIPVPAAIEGRFEKTKDRDFYQFNVEKGQRLVVRAKTRSLGSPCDVFMQLQKADGGKIADSKVTDASEGSITNTFNAAGTYRLLVEELNRMGGSELAYHIDIEPFQGGFALSVETDKVEATKEGTFDLKVSATRREYDGPITLALTEAGDDFALADNVIAEKKNEATLKVTLPARLEPGQIATFKIIGKARIGSSDCVEKVSTMPALRKIFSQALYPPAELDGLIGLGIKPAAPKAVEAKPDKKE